MMILHNFTDKLACAPTCYSSHLGMEMVMLALSGQAHKQSLPCYFQTLNWLVQPHLPSKLFISTSPPLTSIQLCVEQILLGLEME